MKRRKKLLRPKMVRKVVRAVGLEPTLLSEPDFESGASTNSTTPAMPDRSDHPEGSVERHGIGR